MSLSYPGRARTYFSNAPLCCNPNTPNNVDRPTLDLILLHGRYVGNSPHPELSRDHLYNILYNHLTRDSLATSYSIFERKDSSSSGGGYEIGIISLSQNVQALPQGKNRKTLLLLNLHSQGKTLFLKSNSFLPSFLVPLCLQLQGELLLRLVFMLSQELQRQNWKGQIQVQIPSRLPAARMESFEPSVLLAPVSLSLSVPSSIPLEVGGFSGNEINQ